MSKWNKPLSRDTKVKSYYNVSQVNMQKRVDMFNILSSYLKETNDFEVCNALRGLIHGSNISNSFRLLDKTDSIIYTIIPSSNSII